MALTGGWKASAAPPPSGQLNLAPNPSFELDGKRWGGWCALGVVPIGQEDRIRYSEARSADGARSLEIRSGPFGQDPSFAGVAYFADYNGGEGRRELQARDGIEGVRTIALRLEPNVLFVRASAWVYGAEDASLGLSLVWTTRRERRPVVELHRDTVRLAVEERQGWRRFEVRRPRPAEAVQVQLCLETRSDQPVYLDAVELDFERRPETRLLVNQLGFEPESRAKRILLQTTQPSVPPGKARLIDTETFEVVHEVDWVDGGTHAELGYSYWSADFSGVRRQGRYVVAAGRGREQVVSPRFSIRANLLQQTCARLAYQFYTSQRCGEAVPGVHDACHSDDARLPDGTWRDLRGGWHDAGDYNKYNGLTPDAVRRLAELFHRKHDWYAQDDKNGNGIADILDEALWGLNWLDRMWTGEGFQLWDRVSSGYRYWGSPETETDLMPDSGDERRVESPSGDRTHCVAAYARLGAALSQVERESARALGRRYLAFSEQLYGAVGGDLSTQLALAIATGRDTYRTAVNARVQQLLAASKANGGSPFRELAAAALWDASFVSETELRRLAASRVEELRRLCDNPFRVACLPGPSGTPFYCRPYEDVNDWYVGETAYRLDLAVDGLLAGAWGIGEGRELAEHQINWIFGCNPAGVSLMEGLGSTFAPGYHHRYNAIPGNPRGAVPGAIVNGFVRAFPHVDRPWLDLCPEPNADYHSNEPWLLQNNRWLEVLTWW